MNVPYYALYGSDDQNSVGEYQRPEPCRDTADETLRRVSIALNYVSLCNAVMGVRGFSSGIGEPVVRDQELHPSQEGAFRIACQLLGQYFSEGLRDA